MKLNNKSCKNLNPANVFLFGPPDQEMANTFWLMLTSPAGGHETLVYDSVTTRDADIARIEASLGQLVHVDGDIGKSFGPKVREPQHGQSPVSISAAPIEDGQATPAVPAIGNDNVPDTSAPAHLTVTPNPNNKEPQA